MRVEFPIFHQQCPDGSGHLVGLCHHYHIHFLEEIPGACLFVRSNRRAALTEATA